jgi:hypothetical protein
VTALDFDKLLHRRLELTRGVLGMKAGEYAPPTDRLHNFRTAAILSHQTPAEALRGMLVKHWVSVMDIVARGPKCPDEVIDEKVGDAINYLVLLEAVLKERPA